MEYCKDPWYFLYGDEERHLLDRMKELNKNIDKETRIKFLKSEVRKREKLLKRRLRRRKRYIINI